MLLSYHDPTIQTHVNSDSCQTHVDSDMCQGHADSGRCKTHTDSDRCETRVDSDVCQAHADSDSCQAFSNPSTVSLDSLCTDKYPVALSVPFVVISTDISHELFCEVTPDNHRVYLESTSPMKLYSDSDVMSALSKYEAK